jgi:putative ABC transport system permease protein
MNSIYRDVVYVLRGWRRAPATALGALAVLGLAFGLSATVFGLVCGVFLRPLPFRDPGRLVAVLNMHKTHGYGGASYDDFVSWSRDSSVFETTALLGVGESALEMPGSDEVTQIPVARVTAGFFPMLGVSPQQGRWFLSEEASSGRNQVVILSHDAWRRWFGRGTVLGRDLRLDGRAYTVVGVMPAGFQFNYGAIVDVFEPLVPDTLNRAQRQHATFGRLRPGATIAAAQKQLDALAARYEREAPALNANWGYRVVPMHHASDWIDQPVSSALLMAFAVSIVVLLIAGTNVTSLLLARALSRSRQVSIRMALGSTRGRVVRLAIVESTMLSVSCAVLGLGVAALCGRAAVGLLPGYLDLHPEGASAPILTFALALSLLAGGALGLAPAFQMTRRNPAEALRQGPESVRPGGWSPSLMGLLVTGQVALALALLVNGAVLVQSLTSLLTKPLGYRTDNVLVAKIALSGDEYANGTRVAAYYEDLVRRMQSLPGVVSAAAGQSVPMTGDYSGVPTLWEGQAMPEDARAVRALAHAVTPGYFKTLGIPMLRGRDFDARDSADSEPVAVVSQALLRRGGPAGDPIGRKVGVAGVWRTVIGVVGDVRHRGPTSDRIDDDVYVPHAQSPVAGGLRVVVHTRSDDPALVAALRATVQEVDPRGRVRSVTTMATARKTFTSGTHTLTIWVLALAAFGLVLATSGLFGLMAYWVSLHTRDHGIRLAIGASPAAVLRATLQRGLRWAGLGMVIGIALAHGSARLVGHHVFGVQGASITSYLVAVAAVAIATCAACYLPARRAARSNPADVLRA